VCKQHHTLCTVCRYISGADLDEAQRVTRAKLKGDPERPDKMFDAGLVVMKQSLLVSAHMSTP